MVVDRLGALAPVAVRHPVFLTCSNERSVSTKKRQKKSRWWLAAPQREQAAALAYALDLIYTL
jgi:hypothetical protein